MRVFDFYPQKRLLIHWGVSKDTSVGQKNREKRNWDKEKREKKSVRL